MTLIHFFQQQAMWFENPPTLDEQYMNIALATRSLKKQSDKAQKLQHQYLKRAREAVGKSDLERAELFAQQSVRHKHNSLRYLNLSLRMEIVATMAQSAITSGHITDSVSNIINTVNRMSSPANLMSSISNFETLFDDLSITVDAIGHTLDGTAGVTCPEASELLGRLREEKALETLSSLPSTNKVKRSASDPYLAI